METDDNNTKNIGTIKKVDNVIDEQIYEMFINRKHSISDIAKMLNLREEAIIFSLSNREKRELGSRYSYIVERFNSAKDTAIDTLIELSSRSDSESVRADCAKVILEYVSGNKEPKGIGIKEKTAKDFNDLIEEAALSYFRSVGNKLGKIDVNRVLNKSNNEVNNIEIEINGNKSENDNSKK